MYLITFARGNDYLISKTLCASVEFQSLLQWPRAVCIRATSLVSQVADLLYKADRAIYGVKWTIFFCLFVLFCQAGEEKQKRNQMWQHCHRRVKNKNNPHHYENWKQRQQRQHQQQQHMNTEHEKEMFLISNFFFYCSNATIQYGCLGAAVSFVSWAQSKHGVSTVNTAEK